MKVELKPTRFGFGEGLAEIAKTKTNIIGLGADISSSVSLDFFAKQFPERFYSFGIAEQNIVGVAAGLALSGKIPIFSTYAVFASLRAADQIRISLCYNNLPVIIGGAHAGISVGPDGATHQALEDIAVMRVMPNMTVISPCDANQTHKATIAAIENIKGPVYIRFGREAMPNFTSLNLDFEIGKAQILKQGKDITIIATGNLVWEALEAAKKLEKKNISAKVLNIHTIKPIDKEAIINAAKETGKIITAEEHQIIGGLGSAVAEVLSENHPVPIKMIGINDSFGESGNASELMDKYGLRSKDIVKFAEELLYTQTT